MARLTKAQKLAQQTQINQLIASVDQDQLLVDASSVVDQLAAAEKEPIDSGWALALAEAKARLAEKTIDQPTTVDVVTVATEILGDTMQAEQTTDQTVEVAPIVEVTPIVDELPQFASLTLPQVSIKQGKNKPDATLDQVADKIRQSGVVHPQTGQLSERAMQIDSAAKLLIEVVESFDQVDTSSLSPAHAKKLAAAQKRVDRAIVSTVRIAQQNANALVAILGRGPKLAQKDDNLRLAVKAIFAEIVKAEQSGDNFLITTQQGLTVSVEIKANDLINHYDLSFAVGKFAPINGRSTFVPNDNQQFTINKIVLADDKASVKKAVDLIIYRLAQVLAVK